MPRLGRAGAEDEKRQTGPDLLPYESRARRHGPHAGRSQRTPQRWGVGPAAISRAPPGIAAL